MMAKNPSRTGLLLKAIALCFALSSCQPTTETATEMSADFDVREATIAAIHQAFRDGRLTSRALVEHYLERIAASLGDNAPYKTLEEIVASGMYLGSVQGGLDYGLSQTTPPEDRDPPCLDLFSTERNIAFRNAVLGAMEQAQIDAIIYPTWSNPPRKVGDRESPAGDNSQILSPQTGFPAITVPAGFTSANLPAGMTFVGRLFDEPALIRFVYAYEQATQHRRPPAPFSKRP